ncbi:MAG: pyrroline-5-carboxylate reductase [Candidatus Aceula lacicola]|nr:pyrroline-5-carboxylate reductase [Candidatus Aceula lacicola]
MKKIGIIGCGNMGGAILAGARRKFSIVVSETCHTRQKYLKKVYRVTAKSLKDLLKACDVVVLAVKPQNIDDVLKQFEGLALNRKLFISIAAGITTNYLEKRIGGKIHVVRAMPNLPAKIQKGVTAICKGKNSSSNDLKVASSIFNTVGKTIVVKENLIDSVTAVSGSGPGYIYLFIEEMIKAAKALGLSDKIATDLVIQSFDGSIELLRNSTDSAQTLRKKVTSKGGTTQAAIDVFLKKKIDVIFKQALKAAQRRSKELSRR